MKPTHQILAQESSSESESEVCYPLIFQALAGKLQEAIFLCGTKLRIKSFYERPLCSRDGLHLKTVHKLYNNNTYDNILGAHFTLEWCSVQLPVHAIFDAYGFFRPYSVY